VLALATNTLHSALCIQLNLFKNVRLCIAIVRSAWRQPNVSKHISAVSCDLVLKICLKWNFLYMGEGQWKLLISSSYYAPPPRSVHPSVCLSVCRSHLGQLGAQRLCQATRAVRTADPSAHGRRSAAIGGVGAYLVSSRDNLCR